MANALNNYPILRQLKWNFVEAIRLINVFGLNGDEVILADKHDTVYSYGHNRYGCLGVGHDKPVKEPTVVPQLSGKRVIKLAFGWSHALALTDLGEVYSWGHNAWGQLGDATTDHNFSPKLVDNLFGVIDICCGGFHSLTLTESGSLYAWGANDYREIGHGFDGNQLIPIRVHGLDGCRIVAIAAGFAHSLALANNGDVFSWGHNAFGQLGSGLLDIQKIPERIEGLTGILVRKIVCGRNYSLALSINGRVYSFGQNNCGQLGLSSKKSSIQALPVQVDAPHVFTDIEATIFTELSVALSSEACCYVWGKSGDCDRLKGQTKTAYDSIDDVFAEFAKPKVTFGAINLGAKPYISDSVAQHFDNAKCSDLRVRVNSRYIYCHKLVLDLRCEHFRRAMSANWSAEPRELSVTEYSFDAYYAFLKYVYTDSVEIKTADQLIELMRLAVDYGESELIAKCELVVLNNELVSVDNVCRLYATGLKCGARRLTNFCHLFALENYKIIENGVDWHDMAERLAEDYRRLAFRRDSVNHIS